MFLLENLSAHVVYIIAEANRKTVGKAVIEPTVEAEEQWAARILEGAAAFSSLSGCTPGYYNREGEIDNMSLQEKIKAARGSLWSKGIVDYVEAIEAWREENSLDGLEIGIKP